VNLTGADLSEGKLNGAFLDGANLAKTKLAYVDLTDAYYAPASEPPDPYVANIKKGLETLNVAFQDEIGLVQLRKLLHDAGLRDDERKAPYSIQRSITRDQFSSPFWSLGWLGGFFRFAGFDATTAYGLYPWRALLLILGLGAILTCVYIWPIWLTPKDPGTGSGIFQVFPADRIKEASPNPNAEEDAKVVRVDTQEPWDALRKAAWFALLSAVNIGFKEFTPGDWIRRLLMSGKFCHAPTPNISMVSRS
jgi:hypothetical protein